VKQHTKEEITGMDEMDDVIKEFLVESNEGLDLLDHDLVELEKDPKSSSLLSSIFRAVHTIKGTGGVLGFEKLTSVAHVGENLLSRMRDGKLFLCPPVTTVLLTLSDALRKMLTDIESGGSEGEEDYSNVITAINAILNAPSNPASESSPTTKAVEVPKIGEILVSAGVTEPEAVQQALSQQQTGDLRLMGNILVENKAVEAQAVTQALQVQEEKREALGSNTIRADVGLLDKLMNLVGELVLARNQVLQFTATTKDTSFLGTAQRLNLITTELQEGVMKTRMQPIGNVWNKLPRVVRDLALSCGKQVHVEMQGSDTELDKTIIEAIKDPLTHIVRNAVDHGIEVPEARKQAGKASEGRLLLRAFHEGGQVNIEISDDGAGINVERLKHKAVQHGFVSAEQAARMSEREALNLAFLPGVSSAKAVTNVSGRGVGMDVVKTNIEKIGGFVDINSVVGKGTTLKIKIPLTLAIIPALIVTSGGERFAIPQVSLLELVRLEDEKAIAAIENLGGAPVYRLRGSLLPLVDLNRQLRLRTGAAGESKVRTVNIVVLQADARQFGLIVDEINDTEEIVVKPLSKQLKAISCFAGATIMGDGHVALILDVMGIAQMANVITEAGKRALSDGAAKTAGLGSHQNTWLVFRAAGTARMAIPLSSVSRLEEIPAHTVEHSGESAVVQYRGQIMPLVRVSSALQRADAGETDMLQVIVYTEGGRYIGLVVDEIVDIVEQQITPEQCGKHSGVLSSAVIQQKVTDILDLNAVIANSGLRAEAAAAVQGA
jgi:two-component system chemotaxis sensor kinase CheA